MKTNKIVALIIVLNCLALGGLYYLVTNKNREPISLEHRTIQLPKKFIAVFEPVMHPAIQEITAGFVAELQKSFDVDPTIYNANGNKTLLRAQAEEILQKNYDLIFSIGSLCTQTVKELSSKKGNQIPVVFSSVDDPVGIGIVAQLVSSGNNLTGVTDQPDYKEQMELLFALKPTVKNLLLVYDPSHGTGSLQEAAKIIKNIMQEKNGMVQVVEVMHANELQQKVGSFLSHVDTLLIFKDNTVVSGVDTLIKLCNQYGVTLYASDLNSGQKGAALAYGITEQESGVQAARKAVLILRDKKLPRDIPINPITGQQITVNKKTISLQRLVLDPMMLLIISKSKVLS